MSAEIKQKFGFCNVLMGVTHAQEVGSRGAAKPHFHSRRQEQQYSVVLVGGRRVVELHVDVHLVQANLLSEHTPTNHADKPALWVYTTKTKFNVTLCS